MTPDISKGSKGSDESRFITVTPAEYKILEKVWGKRHQQLKTPPSKARSKSSTFVQFRIKSDEADFLSNAAIILYNEGVIKAPTIPALARSCVYTQMNQWLLIQQRNAMMIEHDKRMKQSQASVSGGLPFSYLQPLEPPWGRPLFWKPIWISLACCLTSRKYERWNEPLGSKHSSTIGQDPIYEYLKDTL